MGAWIEIYGAGDRILLIASHPTMGAWIEINRNQRTQLLHYRRTPRWVRGLK